MLSLEIIKKLKEDLNFQQFQEHVLDKMSELNTISDLSELSDEQAGQKARARAIAIAILKEILSPVIDFYEKEDHSIKEIQKRKKRYGL